jgi:hypothetical protein
MQTIKLALQAVILTIGVRAFRFAVKDLLDENELPPRIGPRRAAPVDRQHLN